MVTEEEKEEIIRAAVERTLTNLPEVVGNLMANHAAMAKLNSEFYRKHPEFRNHKDVVATVVEMVEGKNPNLEYEELLNKSIPEIKKRIKTVKNLDTETVSEPDIKLKSLDFKPGHGEI